ncbi:hypothetical protein [Pedobacter insulae]|uniref:DUF4412 domain-containing protein n=1 Tax=Pedobacter insulae TaxID=414048 RepID=A0A1I2Y7W2_9SPHI|nr:hypothetical protein [Pedobacter insulae]SFH21429.1 hypothetical protein SAMN04489864_106264 [Pedobacter insulae]
MKRIFLSVVCLFISVGVFAQKVLPEFKDGTRVYASAFVQGQEVPVSFTIKSIKTPITFAWSVEGYGDGEFVISEKGLANGTSIYTSQPGLGTTKLSDTETYGVISKAAYKSMVDTKALTYNGIKFKTKTPDPNPMKIDGKEMDATRITSEDGKVELWILNNPDFPFILQTAGMPIDVVVTEIK